MLSNQPVHPPEPRPGWRIAWIVLQRLLVEIAGNRPAPGIRRQLVRAQVVLVRSGGCRRVVRQQALFATREWQRERLDDAAGEIVLELKGIVQRHLRRVGPE